MASKVHFSTQLLDRNATTVLPPRPNNLLSLLRADKKGEITDAPQYRPALSVQESEQLLRSLDEMTDAEVAAVLSKLKSAVGERIKSE
jgi:hypothetical protein